MVDCFGSTTSPGVLAYGELYHPPGSFSRLNMGFSLAFSSCLSYSCLNNNNAVAAMRTGVPTGADSSCGLVELVKHLY